MELPNIQGEKLYNNLIGENIRPVLLPGWITQVNWVMFCPGHLGLTRFKNYHKPCEI